VKTRRLLTTLLACTVLGLAACGDDDDDGADTGATETTAEQSAPAGGDVDTSKKPKVTVPEGEPPAGLEIKDLKVGEGQTAKSGDNVTVHYVGVAYSTGKQFDASWDRGEPFPFTLGAGQVIPGWDQGVAGMKVGGRRELTIPPDLAYGETGAPPDIGPNETLIFVVDLLKIG
jgi:peptidylprolyl isomerase